MTRYNLCYAFAFDLVTLSRDGALCRRDAGRTRSAILTRLASLDDTELVETVGMPFDRCQNGEDAGSGGAGVP